MLPRLGAWWFRPAPPLRLATVRVLVSVYGLIWLLAAAPLLYGCIDFPVDRFEPVGIVAVLEAPLPAWGSVGRAARWHACCLRRNLRWTAKEGRRKEVVSGMRNRDMKDESEVGLSSPRAEVGVAGSEKGNHR
jgi:hypothetical protein